MNNRPLKNTKLNNEILQWQEFLKKHSACESGYLEASDKLPQQWWDMTEKPDWMIWVLKKLPQYKQNKRNKLIWVRIALVCAKEIVHLAKDPQQRPQKAIEAAEQWLLDPSEENRLKCRVVASAAKDYAASAAYASAASAASASASTSASASYAYASASYAASAVSIRKGICEKIREIIPQLVIGVI